MHYLKLMTLIGFILCVGCNDVWKRSETTRRFIPGAYVKEVKNEFLIAHDTLIIQCSAGNNYLIVNRTAYQRIRNNKLLPEQYSEENWKALYDDKSQNLYEQRLGKTFSFDPVKRKLFEGGSEYNKITP
jgi:hypothetical protein